MPTNISTKKIIKSVLNVNLTALKQSLRHIGIDIGLAFFGILVGIILMVNGIIALIGGTVILIHDWRRGNINRFLDDI
jgi:tetrahydromethanopterin S-methyltransferase subunit G